MADTIKQKIVFAMGTTGTQKATKSIGSMAVKVVALGAGIAIAVKGMSKMYDAAVTLDRQLQSLNTDMGLYNQQTKGLIDTNDGLSAAIQLQNANISASAEEMAAMGKAAIKMNQDLGGKAGGSTEIFNGLVKSIVNARETGLVKFGIELSQTGDKAAASKEAMQKLVEKFGDVNVEAETAKEQLYAFNNSLGTVTASEFNGFLNAMNANFMAVVGSTEGASDAMVSYEEDIMATKGTISEYMWTMDGMALRGATWIASILGNADAVASLNDEYRAQVDLLTELEFKRGLLDSGKKSQALYEDWKNAEGDDFRLAGKRAQASLKGKLSSEYTDFDKVMVNSGILGLDFSEPKKRTVSKKSSRGGGGGGGIKAQDSMDFSLTEIETFDSVRDDMTFTEADADLSNAQFNSLGAAGRGAGRAQAEQGRLEREAQFQRELANLKLGAQQSTLSMMLGMEQQYLAESNRMNAISNEQKAQAVTDLGSTTVSVMDNTAKAVDASSRKGFKATQAMNYASNAINTTQSAIAGYKSVMNSAVPFPLNVIAGGALATSIGVAGAAAGNKIRNQKYGSTSGSSSVKVPKTSFPSGGIGTGGGSTGGDTVINVRVGGNTIHREVMSANDLANQSGDKHFTTGEV